MITIYHSSPKPIERIKPYGYQHGAVDFGGVFALSNPEGSIDHGSFLHQIELEESDVLTQWIINTELPSDGIETVLRKNLRIESEEDLSLAKQITEFDRNVFDFTEEERERLCHVFRSEMDCLAWEGQRVRGQIALAAGYKAVEMSDEHGTSYLVLPGAEITLVAGLVHEQPQDAYLASLDLGEVTGVCVEFQGMQP